MKPVVDRLRTEFDGRVEFRLYNFDHDDDASSVADEYAVRYVPTFIFLDSSGDLVDQRVGAMPEEDLRDLLNSLE